MTDGGVVGVCSQLGRIRVGRLGAAWIASGLSSFGRKARWIGKNVGCFAQITKRIEDHCTNDIRKTLVSHKVRCVR